MNIEHPWKTYAIVASLSTAIYYVFLVWRFYLPELKNWIKQRRQPIPEQRAFPTAEPEAFSGEKLEIDFSSQSEQADIGGMPDWQNDEMYEKAQSLMTHLALEIREAHEKNYSKHDLLLMMQMILKDYYVLEGTPYQLVINDRMVAECAKYGSIHLSEGETIQVWRKVV